MSAAIKFEKTWFATIKARSENGEDLTQDHLRVMAYLESKVKALSSTKEKKPVVTLIFRDALGNILICTGWRALAGSTRDDPSPLMDHVEVGKIYDSYFSVETFYNLNLSLSNIPITSFLANQSFNLT